MAVERLPGKKRFTSGSVLADLGILAWFVFSLFPIVWMILLGWFVFGQFPDRWTFIGAGVVIASGLYLLYRERVRNVPEGSARID